MKARFEKAKEWLQGRLASWPRTVILLFVGLQACGFLLYTDAFVYGDSLFFGYLRSMFYARTQLNLEPSFPKNIKVIVFDDHSVAHLKTLGMGSDRWASVLGYLDTHKPKAIFIDKLFYQVDDDTSSLDKALGEMDSPVYIGSFVNPTKIARRPVLSAHAPTKTFRVVDPVPEWAKGEFFYGGDPEVIRHFSGVGTITYTEFGLIHPYRIVGGKPVLHLSMLSGETFAIEDGALTIDGHTTVRPNPNGHIVANLHAIPAIAANAMTMKSIVRKMQKGKVAKKIRPNDVVLIVPRFFTGNTDFVNSAIGRIPGGFMLASMIASPIQDNYLGFFRYYKLLFVGVLLLTILLMRFSIAGQVIAVIVVNLSILGVSLGLFLGETLLNFFPPMAHFSALSLVTIGVRGILQMRREQEHRKAMETIGELQSVITPPETSEFANVRIWSRCFSAEYLSGDFCFQKQVGDFVYLFLGDVSGHGIRQGFAVSFSVGYLNRLIESAATLKDAVQSFDEVFTEYFGGQLHLTLFALRYDTVEGTLTYVNAGHRPSFLYLQGGKKAKLLSSSGSPMGYAGHGEPVEKSLDIPASASLLVLSDGLFENGNHLDEKITHRSLSKRFVAEFCDDPERLGRWLGDLYDNRQLEDDVTISLFRVGLRAEGDAAADFGESISSAGSAD